MLRLAKIANQLTPQGAPAPGLSNVTSAGASLDSVTEVPPDAIFHVKAQFAADKDERKINLGIGAYRDENGKPYVLSVVKKAEQLIAADGSLNHEYFGITGDAGFTSLSQGLIFDKKLSSKIASVQTLSGTGSLRVAGEFLKQTFPHSAVYLSNPTWGNHKGVFGRCGLNVKFYRYWNASGRNLDYDGMISDLSAAPRGSIVVLHACAHNPTGVDPTPDQWKGIAEVCKRNKLFPFFDNAYQGFASGDLLRDGFAIKYFSEQGFDLLVCQSFAKNLGLYNERIGGLHVLTSSAQQAKAVKTRLAALIRPMYSNPPAHGARIAKTVLGTPYLFKEWQGELQKMSGRILKMRQLLRSNLEKLGTPGTWEHITSQIGMFSFTGLTKAQALGIRKKWHVYMLENGRISMSGINSKNVVYLAKAIDDVVRNM